MHALLVKMKDVVSTVGRAVGLRSLQTRSFPGSEAYWINRYKAGGTSGDGSYGQLAEFKAETLNEFVQEHGIETIMEFGCGDGNQLKLSNYKSYLGFDVSPDAIDRCKRAFAGDPTKSFNLLSQYANQTAELVLSLDVIYHLVEDAVFHEYMSRLFDASRRFVIIYSSNSENNAADQALHVRHREFTRWVDQWEPEWKLRGRIPNKYRPKGGNVVGEFADFYIFFRAQDEVAETKD